MSDSILEPLLPGMITDNLRALVLEYMGYEASVIKVGEDHTAKNIMFAGVKRQQPLDRGIIYQEIIELMKTFGITKQHKLVDLVFNNNAHTASPSTGGDITSSSSSGSGDRDELSSVLPLLLPTEGSVGGTDYSSLGQPVALLSHDNDHNTPIDIYALNKFVEILKGLIDISYSIGSGDDDDNNNVRSSSSKRLPSEQYRQKFRIVDMGCGLATLTFEIHKYFKDRYP